ncbi:hypothetical protein DFH09DRAFT_1188447 [Mycena vulgaris]|nr:hypothetical protein DFH09DRAFT_1188447 [Mycena vulgaris]
MTPAASMAPPSPQGTTRMLRIRACLAAPLSYYTSANGSTSAIPCPVGHFLNTTAQTACLITPAGYYNNVNGPCPAGSYQPSAAQKFRYGAPKGRFQSLSGQSAVCGTCCRWAAPLVNNNVAPVNCNGTALNAWPASGDGCISNKVDCVHAKSCAQNPTTGACPADTFRE